MNKHLKIDDNLPEIVYLKKITELKNNTETQSLLSKILLYLLAVVNSKNNTYSLLSSNKGQDMQENKPLINGVDFKVTVLCKGY